MILACAVTILVGFDKIITLQEWKTINHAKETCKIYYPEAPCLKKFIKKEDLVYNAICGRSKK